MKTLRHAADLTPAAWDAITAVYDKDFAAYLYVDFPELWECLPPHGFVMAALDCEAALVVIDAVKRHREREHAERHRLRWYGGAA